MQRKRLRELGITIGKLKTGKLNAITDVEGIVVGHKTIIDKDVCSGLTVIMPNNGKLQECHFPAGIFAFNGTGEFTGTHWIDETGTLVTPIVFTGSHLLGLAHHYLSLATRRIDNLEPFSNGIVAETWDGWLSDLEKTTIKYEDMEEAIRGAKSGVVEEGNVGGGTGMICFEFKGGIGTASRIVECDCGSFTIGALVQTNFGRRQDLVIANQMVGEIINEQEVPLPWDTPENDGSLLVTLVTDAPLIPLQCKRVSKRAALAMAKLGGIGEEGSGDFFITFSTGNCYAYGHEAIYPINMFPSEQLDVIFEGAIEAVEEAIINSMCMAETLQGQKQRQVHALPQDKLLEILK
ncbi:P1 family peptidase [Geosporobacter ferrireducens]|uniref:Aminopeptidase n=1 Tax=Geosporobacter ferrireducens TaxID=1424294 RepID=A0A1D8GHL0_9FIRM|nr:P1 family peptidase [Geosporobacter ferrireducens]AOT70372.1 aminopeptidase [Geosporobacter ferrireducens]MTI54347.1 P1 family peptidase [Geosporobacter ferrireducens]